VFDRAVADTANHLLAQADWARGRLKPHAGKRVRLVAPPFAVQFAIDADGLLVAADTQAHPDAILSLTSAVLPFWLIDRPAAWREARVEGDAELASAVGFVASNLRWDFEEDLSRVFGDVLAHRIGETLRAARRWQRATAQAAAASVAEYLTEERGILPTRLRIEDFLHQVDELRDAVERLDKRLDRIAARLASRAHH